MDVFSRLARTGRLDLPLPGSGRTLQRWDSLVRLGQRDPVLARLGEGHADARAILAELSASSPPAGVWGVWAAVPQSVKATESSEGWQLSGDRPWCSGAAACTHALVTAVAADGPRLFWTEIGPPWAVPLDGTWAAVGMAASDSRTVRFSDAPATPVGGPDAYVQRPGFWHGAMGVAACWYGGALGVAKTLRRAARVRELDPHAMAHLGAADASLAGAAALLREAARTVDDDPQAQLERLAGQVRAVVEACATEVIDRVGRALGATPLCLDGEHASRVADLTVYLRQSHAERDLAELGALALEGPSPW